jgi:uncharacterized protein (TIGR02246 family)
MTSAEDEVRALLDSRSEALQAMDLERLLSLYSPDVVYFDVVPPLRYTGADALRGRFSDWFSRWASPIGQELREVTVLAGDDVAAAHMLIRTSGTLADGRDVGYWVRLTDHCRRSGGSWLISHEHVSLPADMASGRVVTDLLP